jgi:lysozyme
MLSQGNFGDPVLSAQKLINKFGYGLELDSVFGPLMDKAVRDFQAKHDLKVDGIIGPLTLAVLNQSPLEPVSPPVEAAPGKSLQGSFIPTGVGQVIGVDIYHGDTVTDWTDLSTNARFVIHKTSEGTSRDDRFVERWPLIKSHGMVRGSYHFWHPGSGSAQADLQIDMIDMGGGSDPTDLPLALDYEPANPNPSHNQSIEDWIERVKTQTKRKPIFYTFLSALGSLGNPSYLAEETYLWIATAGRTSPPKGAQIAPFTAATFWQDRESAFPGLAGNKADHDIFLGKVADFALL